MVPLASRTNAPRPIAPDFHRPARRITNDIRILTRGEKSGLGRRVSKGSYTVQFTDSTVRASGRASSTISSAEGSSRRCLVRVTINERISLGDACTSATTLERSNFVLWNVAVRLPTRVNAGYRQENGRDLASTFTVRCADMTFVRSSSGQNKLGSFVAMAPHFRFAAVISSPNR